MFFQTYSNLVEHCSASGDASNTISKNNNDNDYLNDVEMENNGHTTNGKLIPPAMDISQFPFNFLTFYYFSGNICKNGNANNFNESIDADEEMGMSSWGFCFFNLK